MRLASFLATALLAASVSSDATAPAQALKDASCQWSFGSLQKLHDMPGYRLTIRTDEEGRITSLHIPYAIYRVDAGDVDNDGAIDVLLGVIKPTHFDPQPKKRLFIYRPNAGGLVPLWLGSRVCRTLVDFRCVRQRATTYVVTVEQDDDGEFCNGVYQWHDFGLELRGYHNECSDYDTAQAYLNSGGSSPLL